MLNFTIIIPTRNRSDALYHTICNVLGQEYSAFRILIADNSSDSQTQELVESFSDHRIDYLKTGPGLSMSSNWEKALSVIEDGWITILGDDDALLQNSLAIVNEIVRNNNVKAVRSISADYIWPGDSRFLHGRLSFVLNKSPELVDSKQAIHDVLEGTRSYATLPMLYNGGFIDSVLLKNAKLFNSNFYHSRIPDVYSAFAFAFLTDSYYLVNHPLAINGTSRHSGGTAFFQYKKNSSQYEPARLFSQEPNLPFHPGVPLLESGELLRSIHAHVLESFLQARDILNPAFPLPNFENQFRLIMSDTNESETELLQWAREFQRIHNLEIEYSARGSRDERPLSRLHLFRNKLVARTLWYVSWPKVFEYVGDGRKSIATVTSTEKLIRKKINQALSRS